MFENMGVQWASTLLGCVAAILVPIPVGFYFWGHRLRARSKFAPSFGVGAKSYSPEDEQREEQREEPENTEHS